MPRRARGGRRAPNLKRRGPQREPKRRFVLFCEGRNTEPAYFRAIGRACANVLVDVRPAAGDPKTIAERATEEAKRIRKGKDSFEKNDRVWAVFDRDEHCHFDEAVKLCEKHEHGVGVARSNPCFELWLVLHERDYDRSCDRRDVQKELERLRPKYDRSGAKTLDWDDIVDRVGEAERRAEAQLRRREREGAPHGNPSTTVFRLTREIRAADKPAKP